MCTDRKPMSLIQADGKGTVPLISPIYHMHTGGSRYWTVATRLYVKCCIVYQSSCGSWAFLGRKIFSRMKPTTPATTEPMTMPSFA